MLKVLYAGSPEASAVTLKLLKENEKKYGYEVVAVLTNPPTAKGRHKALIPTFVGQTAAELGLPVFSPEHLDESARETAKTFNADILVSFAYGHIFGPKFLSLFKFGGINLHPSALPKYRGCSPINAVILNNEKETAFSVQTLSLKMDEGNILVQKKVVLNGKETAGSLLNDAAVSGAELICELLKKISTDGVMPKGEEQKGEASYTTFIKKEDARLCWSSTAEKIDCTVRAYNPEPVAWTNEKGLPLKILSGFFISEEEEKKLNFNENALPGTVVSFEKQMGLIVRCGNGFYSITSLQRQGKNAMDFKAFYNGAKDFVGTVLS